MTKYGIRVSQAGIDVNRAADYQKTMDERWPVLEHMFTGVVELQNFSTASPGVLVNSGDTIAVIPIFQHNLGYLPAYRVRTISFSGFDNFNTPVSQMLLADENMIYLQIFKDPGPVNINVKLFLMVVDRDCNQEYQAPIDIITANQKAQPSKYGVKVLAQGAAQNINDKSKKNFTLNTNAKSMTIQAHGSRTADANTFPSYSIVVDHRLGYPPTFYVANKSIQTGAANPLSGKRMISPIGNIIGLGRSTTLTLTIRGAQAVLNGDYMFIILKDPVDTAK